MSDNDRSRRTLGRRRAVQTAGLAALAGGLGLGAAAAVAAQPQPGPGIVGVWRTSMTGGANRPNVEALEVFIAGGIFLRLDAPIELTANLRDFPDATENAGPYAGQWVERPDGSVHVLAIQLNYDRQPTLTSEERLTLDLRLDPAGDTLSGSYQWRETALDGTLILSFQGDVLGRRVTVEMPEP